MTGEDMKDDGCVLTLDKPRCFKMTWNTMRKLQKEYGTSQEALQKVSEGDYEAILYVLWATQTGDGALSLDELGELIDAQKISAAFATAFSVADVEPKKKGLFRKNAKSPRRK